MVKKIGKPAKFILLSIIILSLLIVLLNILIAAFSKDIVNYVNGKNIGGTLSVDKVNGIFIPFYCKASGVSFKNENVNISSEKINLNISVKNFFAGKPFFKVKLSNINADVNITTDNKSKNLDILRYINFIDLFKINNALLKLRYSDINSTINIDNAEYNGFSNILKYSISPSNISKDNLTEIFTSVLDGQILNNELVIKEFELKGDSVYLSSDNFTLSSEHIRGFMNGHIGSKILNILYPEVEGEISFSSRMEDSKLSFSFKTDRFAVDGQHLSLSGQIFGEYPGLLKFDLGLNNIFGYDFWVKGDFNTETFDILTNIDFKKPVDIYKGYGWHVTIDDTYVKGNIKENIYNVKTEVISEEKYKVSAVASFDYDNLQVYLKELKGVSDTTEINGKAVSDFKSIKINAEGKGKGNGEIKKILNIDAELFSNFEFFVDSKELYLKGNYYSDIPQKIYNIEVKRAEGTYDLTYKGITFFTDADIDNGNLKINGSIDFDKLTSDFNFEMSSVFLSSILDYFEVESNLDIPLTGNANLNIKNDILISKGTFKAENSYFPDNLIKYSIKDKKLYLDYVEAENNIFKNPLVFDFSNGTLYGKIGKDSLKFRDYPELTYINLFVDGQIANPNIRGVFKIDIDNIGKLDCSLTGDINKIDLSASKDNLNVNAMLDLKENSLVSNINLHDYLFDKKNKISASGQIKVSSKDFDEYKGSSDKIILNIDNNSFDFTGISFLSDLKSIDNLSAVLENGYVRNIKLRKFRINKKFIKGMLNFENTEVTFRNSDLELNGNVFVYYNYDKYPKLFGGLKFNGIAYLNDISLKLPVNEGKINFFDYETNILLKGKELDMDYYFTAYLEKYYNPYNSVLNMKGKNLYVNVNNTDISFDMDAYFDNASKTLNSNIFINYLDVHEFDVKSKGESNFKLPINLNVKINTKSPIHIKNKFTDTYINADLVLNLFNNKLKIKGNLNAEKGQISIAGNPFILRQAYLKFTEDNLPYLFITANGTGQNRSILLKVTGFLPEYDIELIDKNPDNSFSFEANSNILNQNNGNKKSSRFLLTELVNGAMLSGIVNVAEKSFGINRIGFEQNKYKGDESNYFKIGKSFSDRFEIKYVVATGEDEESSIVGEYLLMDWLRLVVYASVDGGNGAGFTFFGNF